MKNEFKYTLSSTFIFPLLNIDKSIFACQVANGFGSPILNNRFINAYLDNENFPHFQHYKVHLLLTGYQDRDLQGVLETLESLPNFEEDYEYKPAKKKILSKEAGYLVKIFIIPEAFKADYDLIMEGKYSKISKDAKLRIMNHAYGKKSMLGLLPKIFNKDKELRKTWENKLTYKNSPIQLKGQEVWSKINRKNETLTDKIIEQIVEETKINPLENK